MVTEGGQLRLPGVPRARKPRAPGAAEGPADGWTQRVLVRTLRNQIVLQNDSQVDRLLSSCVFL